MRIKDGFMIREIAGVWVVVPVGAKAVEFVSISSLTETGALAWNMIEKNATKEEILQAILSEYRVDEATARADLDAFLAKAAGRGFLEM